MLIIIKWLWKIKQRKFIKNFQLILRIRKNDNEYIKNQRGIEIFIIKIWNLRIRPSFILKVILNWIIWKLNFESWKKIKNNLNRKWKIKNLAIK